MATNNNKPSSSNSSPTVRFLGFLKQPDASDPTNLELDENDVVWSYIPSAAPSPRPLHSRRRINPLQSGLSLALDGGVTIRKSKEIPAASRPENIPAKFHQSAPVDIPVWPEKLNNFDDVDEEEEECKENEIVPPHVIVARSHSTFSVFEGVGRTLKGRDLRRVRNAVFRKTGFLD